MVVAFNLGLGGSFDRQPNATFSRLAGIDFEIGRPVGFASFQTCSSNLDFPWVTVWLDEYLTSKET